jgi:hypothetical protein
MKETLKTCHHKADDVDTNLTGSEPNTAQNDPEDNSDCGTKYNPFLVKQMSQLRFWAGTQLTDGMSWSQNLKIIQS